MKSSLTPIDAESINEFPTFYAFRPDWLTTEEQEQFKRDYPELVEKYADCWQEETQEAVAQA